MPAVDATLSSIPIDLLLAELAKRDDDDTRPACGSGKQGSYDTPLHVFALILILALSTLACGFPLISSQSRGRRQSRIVFYCQHFGTGVLIATAFVHLLPTAFLALTDPCLPYFFSKGYTPLPGLIAMVSALVVVSLESYLTTRGAGHSHTHHTEWEEEDRTEDGSGLLRGHSAGGLAVRRGSRPGDIALGEMGYSEGTGLMSGVSPLPESTPTLQSNGRPSNGETNALGKSFADAEEDEDDERESMDLELHLDELTTPRNRSETRALASPGTPKTPGTPHIPTAEEQKRLMLQCVLLEAGILFHSVFIGMAISVATGPPFVVFLVAIAFHQTFEGLALGSRIAALHFPRSSPRPWLMVLAYGTTTPIGQAIGLIVHKFYDPQSQTGLLMVGIMNAISSGLLLFAGLVQLLAEDFLTEKSYKTLKGRTRVNAFLAVGGGATLMAAVGAFA
ncbi:hypothetical protein M406DRAFT_62463 [Cryphonectria parasitica EP155]|uniref:Zinc/iron permease n=1 Tax=Cryphonectria parasitica (strain ATCC 38755 / EP155) TaxID=660469 RepID=A0A9P4Y0U7_CRYP1|nr:uncharacterized protein M406DRAFT_62463 [Cryphonectria parasitica EP155]KAF3764322.1 hypothetical protein M406DRAFT_62463 [Cryphonectria parasitica EP155]